MATGLLALLAKGKPGADEKSSAPGAKEPAAEPDMGSDVEEMAMQDLDEALTRRDYKAAAAAFKRAYEACKSSDSGEEY